MRLIYFCRLDAVMFILLTSAGIVSFSKVSFARNGDGGDQSKCFNSLLHNLASESFSSSSVWKNRAEFEAHQARMSSMIDLNSNHHGQAWCSNGFVSTKPTEWLEIDLGDLKFINSFFTMGRGEGNFKEFVSFFYLEYQRELKHWIRYKNDQNKELINGNGDSRNVAQHKFDSLIVARKIRIYPISKEASSRSCMKIGIYGCNFDDGVIEYSMPQGHFFTINENDKYDFRDLTYDGKTSVNVSTQSVQLVGGLGQLMDNIIYHGTIHNERDQVNRPYHCVGWNKVIMKANKMEIVLKLDQIRQLKEIRLYTLNMIPNEIGVFASATISFSIGGDIYDQISPPKHYKPEVDRRVYHSRWIVISLQGIKSRFVKLILAFNLEWIVLSEIILISERYPDIIPIERAQTTNTSIVLTNRQHITTNQKTSISVKKFPMKKEINEANVKNNENFSKHSPLGFVATLSSCFIGFLLIMALLIFGIVSVRRRHRRLKGKLRYPNYPARMNGGPFIGDSLVVPLTAGTHSSSGTGSIYYKHPGNVDLGLSYPIMGKEYMTLSSKSGTDYDMAGGNSLDGLLPTFKDAKLGAISSHFLQNPFGDNTPYPISAYSRHSNDGSLGSSYNEYATTSMYHFPHVMENRSNIVAGNHPGFTNNNFQLQPLQQNVTSINTSPYKVQSPTPSTQLFGPNQIVDMFPQYSPYRHMPYFNHNSPAHNIPSRFLTPTNFDLFSMPYMTPSSNFSMLPSAARGNVLPTLQGIFGNSIMISTDKSFLPPFSTVSLTNILSTLEEIGQDEIEHISIIGRGEHGSIGYIQTLQSESSDKTKKSQPKTFISKSLSNYVSKDIRNEVVRELSILVNIKHSAFTQLSAYAFDHQNSMSMKQLTLCFLFEIDDQMENLYTMLQQHSTSNPGALNLPRGPILYSQSISNLAKTSLIDERNLYPSIPSLLFICCQIAQGMSYLEIRKIVHRDLSARNCLISENLTIKITDIAMSIQKFKEHYVECTTMQIQLDDDSQTSSALSVVKQNYPLQWMASETILQGTYSVKTDIWSFGVTMWEILTRCQKPPFGELGITIDRLIENAKHLSSGSQEAVLPNGFLSRQQSNMSNQLRSSPTMVDYLCPILDSNLGLTKDFSDLIRECWHKNALQRPSFENIGMFLQDKIDNLQIELLSNIS